MIVTAEQANAILAELEDRGAESAYVTQPDSDSLLPAPLIVGIAGTLLTINPDGQTSLDNISWWRARRTG